MPTPTGWFVHYTIDPPYSPKSPDPVTCVAGPYSMDEVIPQRRDIAGYAGVSNVFVSQEGNAKAYNAKEESHA